MGVFSKGGEMKRLLLLLFFLAALLDAFSEPTPSLVGYSNRWAVQITGGSVAANDLAREHGFINLGQVRYMYDSATCRLWRGYSQVTSRRVILMHATQD